MGHDRLHGVSNTAAATGSQRGLRGSLARRPRTGLWLAVLLCCVGVGAEPARVEAGILDPIGRYLGLGWGDGYHRPRPVYAGANAAECASGACHVGRAQTRTSLSSLQSASPLPSRARSRAAIVRPSSLAR